MKRNLIPEVEALLDKPDDERIAYAQQDKWVGYPFAKALLDKMVRLLSAPRTIRVKSMIVVGDPNAGKTTIKLRFLNLNRGCKKLCVNGHRRLQPVTTGGTDGHTERRARLP
ncbi:MAG: hypothetical protein CVU69_10125, partial [Deltaproteobacteria bacterium HGW-Deltaproteobacteria-4]